MQKKIIALAVAGLVSGAAFAQSNVTVYGVVDVFGAHAKADNSAGDEKFNGIQPGGLSGSRLGFNGQEDLGNGLKAIFTLEYGTLDVTANSGIASTRQTFVGLDSKTMGKLTAGRLQGIGYNFDIAYDAHGASVFSPLRTLTTSAGAMITSGTARLENAVAYTSPRFGGFKVNAEYAFVSENETNAAKADAETQWGLSAEYANGPFKGGVAYIAVKDDGDTAIGASEAKQKDWALGASYDFKVVKLLASYQQHKVQPASGAEVKDKLWNIGASIPVGAASTINVAYAKIKDDAATQLKASSYAIDYEHKLSKRTTAYVAFSRVSNGTNATYNYSTSSITTTGFGPTASGDVNLYGVGVRHTF